jgi:hypothetical protein
MSQEARILWLVGGGLVCIDWAVKLWLLSAFWCTTCAAMSIVSISGPPPPLPTERISEAGVHYGHCAGTTLAVFLFPEPCGWDKAPPNQSLARP